MLTIWNKYFEWPPVWLLIFMGIAKLQTWVWNPFSYQSGSVSTVGWVIVWAGIALMGLSFVMFLQHKTSVVPKRIPNSVISTGPYRFSRNPIYLADAIVLIGYILTLGSVVSFILVPMFMKVIEMRFIEGEETHIRAEFGAPYAEYCKQTRRWI